MIYYLKSSATRNDVVLSWLIAFVLTIGILFLSGQIYSEAQAKELLEGLQKASLYYASAIIGSSATILALMLTLLTFIQKTDKPSRDTFTRLHAITAFCVYSFMGALILMLFISFPIEVFEDIPDYSFKYAFYILCLWNGMLAGHMISTILILKKTTLSIIGGVSPDFDKKGDKTDK